MLQAGQSRSDASKNGIMRFKFDFLSKVNDNAAQMRYISNMKTATLPSVRVEPELRASVESLLGARETLSEFVENSVRQAVIRRHNQAEFVKRGITSLESALRTSEYVESDAVLEKLELKLAMAKKQMQARIQ